MNEKLKPCPAPMYSLVYSKLRPLFQEIGYNLVCHGSMNRDLDLIAIPWVDKCGTLEDIVTLMIEQEFMLGGDLKASDKPHGRKAYVFLFEWDHPHLHYIDLSIMVPRQSPPPYETPEQYRERTGEEYPDEGLVWVPLENIQCNGKLIRKREWGVRAFKYFKAAICVIAHQPPADWRPE